MKERTSFGLRVAALAGLMVTGGVAATAWDGAGQPDEQGTMIVAGDEGPEDPGLVINPSTCC
jgi:hypothetical protein